MMASDWTGLCLLMVVACWVSSELALRSAAWVPPVDPCRERPSALPRLRCDSEDAA